MEIIDRYFPDLTPLQRDRFAALEGLYADWNMRINVISRRDMEHFYERHVLHSLALTRVCRFADGATVLDVGTGGGFPGIPLAIMFPEVQFVLVDSIGKKIAVVRAVVEALGLQNVAVINGRAEAVPGRFDCVVSRAVAPMKTLLEWVWPKVDRGGEVIVLKGGDLSGELTEARRLYTLYNIADFFAEDFFATKRVVRIQKK